MQPPEPTPKLSVLMGIEGSGTRTDPGSLESEIIKVYEEKRSMDTSRMNGQGGDLAAEGLRLDGRRVARSDGRHFPSLLYASLNRLCELCRRRSSR